MNCVKSFFFFYLPEFDFSRSDLLFLIYITWPLIDCKIYLMCGTMWFLIK